MNVFVMVDMEGIAGVDNGEELHPGSAEYELVDGCTIQFTRDDMLAAYRLLRLLTVLCSFPR